MRSTVFKISTMIVFSMPLAVVLASTHASAQTRGAGSSERLESFADEGESENFIKSLGDLSRKSGKDQRSIERDVFRELDIRLTKIDKVCDIGISHHLLKVGYAVRARVPTSMVRLREHAQSLSQMNKDEFRSVSSKCRAELIAFGKAIMRSHGINIKYQATQNRKNAVASNPRPSDLEVEEGRAVEEEDDSWWPLW